MNQSHLRVPIVNMKAALNLSLKEIPFSKNANIKTCWLLRDLFFHLGITNRMVLKQTNFVFCQKTCESFLSPFFSLLRNNLRLESCVILIILNADENQNYTGFQSDWDKGILFCVRCRLLLNNHIVFTCVDSG